MKDQAPGFITTFGPDRNISYSANFENIETVEPKYIGFENVKLEQLLVKNIHVFIFNFRDPF